MNKQRKIEKNVTETLTSDGLKVLFKNIHSSFLKCSTYFPHLCIQNVFMNREYR